MRCSQTAVAVATASLELTEELEWLRQDNAALGQALQEEKAKQPVPAPAHTPDTPERDFTADLKSRLVGRFRYLTGRISD